MRYFGLLLLCSCLSALGVTYSPTINNSINLKDVGADATGTNDINLILQNALNNAALDGRSVFVPRGKYRVNGFNYINVPSNARLYGEFGTRMILNPGITNDLQCIFRVFMVTNVVIDGFELDGNRALPGINAHAILAYYATNTVYKNIVAKDWTAGAIEVGHASDDFQLLNWKVFNSGRNGGEFTYCTRGKIINCNFSTSSGFDPQYGVDVEPNAGEYVNDLLFSNCTFADNTHGGLYVNLGAGLYVSNIVADACIMRGNGWHGAAFSRTYNCAIRNSQIFDNHASGIYLERCLQTGVTANKIHGIDGNGILLEGGADCNIGDNDIFDVGFSGINSTATTMRPDNINITGNRIHRPLQAGIWQQNGDRWNVTGNKIFYPGWNGAVIVTSYDSTYGLNTIIGAGWQSSGAYAGFLIGSGSSRNHVVNNTIRNSFKGHSAYARGGGASTIVLGVTAAPLDSYYTNMIVQITSGPGSNDVRTITGYVGGTLTATVSAPWSATPTTNSTYWIRNSWYQSCAVQLNAGAFENRVVDNYVDSGSDIVDLGSPTNNTIRLPADAPGSHVVTFQNAPADGNVPSYSGTTGNLINDPGRLNFDTTRARFWIDSGTPSSVTYMGVEDVLGALPPLRFGHTLTNTWQQSFGAPHWINSEGQDVYMGSPAHAIQTHTYGIFTLENNGIPFQIAGDGTKITFQSFGSVPIDMNALGNGVKIRDLSVTNGLSMNGNAGQFQTNTWTATGTNWTQVIQGGIVTSMSHTP